MKFYNVITEKLETLKKLNQSLGHPNLLPLKKHYDVDSDENNNCNLYHNAMFWFDEIISAHLPNSIREKIESTFGYMNFYDYFIAFTNEDFQKELIGYDIDITVYYQILLHIEDAERQLLRYKYTR